MTGEKNAFVLEKVVKRFKKRVVRREYSTVKTELVRLLTGQRRPFEPWNWIEALKGVDLVVPKGKTIGIIGRNGSGKSTLLKLMTGIYTPTEGKLTANGRISALLDLGAGFHPDFTGRENVLINGVILGMTRAEVKRRMDDIIAFAELGDFIDEQVRTYSSGMFMRLAFAVATHVDPEILIIDEILAVGDEHFQKKSFAKMSEFKGSGNTIVLVTHDLATVTRWCDLAAWIDGGVIRMCGEPKAVADAYLAAVAEAEATHSVALTTPGLPLPQVTGGADTPAAGPPPPGPGLTIRLLDVEGADVASLPGDARLEVLLEWKANDLGAIGLTVELHSMTTCLFSTTLEAGKGGDGRARLSIPRLGLGEGAYALTASLHPAGMPAKNWVKAALAVTARAPGVGVLRPAHVWSLDAAAAPQVKTP